jgi:predicted RNA binding protein with dsRBD fold (UPF0201 family)
MIEVFKTNIQTSEEASRIRESILNRFPTYAVNMDLEDCDRILRVKGEGALAIEDICQMVMDSGFSIEVLE